MSVPYQKLSTLINESYQLFIENPKEFFSIVNKSRLIDVLLFDVDIQATTVGYKKYTK